MTNLLNVLKTMETETTGVKNDVINWLLEDVEGYSPQAKLHDLLSHGCQSGMVNHLIYTNDTVEYFENHEREIFEFVSEAYGLDMYGGSEFIDQLADMFPVDDFETRMNDHDIYEKAMEIVEENNDITNDELYESIEDYEEEVFDERYELSTTLEDQDKNYLAWAIFEYEAVNLENELSEMEVL